MAVKRKPRTRTRVVYHSPTQPGITPAQFFFVLLIMAIIFVVVFFINMNSTGGTNKSIHVHGYTRKDGTPVQSYDRKPPSK